MKRIIFTLAVFCFCAIIGCAVGEDYIGTWCAYSYTDSEGFHQPILQSLTYVPCIEIREENTVKVTMGNLETKGTWYMTDDSHIVVQTEDIGEFMLIPIDYWEMQLDVSATDNSCSEFVLKRYDDFSAAGEWVSTLYTNENGYISHPDKNAGITTFYEDGTAEQHTVFRGSIINQTYGTWKRIGNEIVFYADAKDSEGNKILVPYQFFWMDSGILCHQRETMGQDRLILLRTNTENKKRKINITDLKDLAGTSWINCGEELDGQFISLDVVGFEPIFRLSFDLDGSCTLIRHHNGEDYCFYSPPFGIVDGEACLYFDDKSEYRVSLTDDHYLRFGREDFWQYFKPDKSYDQQ